MAAFHHYCAGVPWDDARGVPRLSADSLRLEGRSAADLVAAGSGGATTSDNSLRLEGHPAAHFVAATSPDLQRRAVATVLAPAGTAVVALTAEWANRFTVVTTPAPDATATLTVGPYAGLLDGAEHELYNGGPGGLTVQAEGAPTVVQSLGDLNGVALHGAAVLKHLADGTWALMGALT